MSKFKIPPNATVKEILTAIDNWSFSGADVSESLALWNILSAMRGPDSNDWRLKDTTTAVIRAVALPRLASISGATISSGSKYDLISRLSKLNDYTKVVDHFSGHIFGAAEALVSRFNEEEDNEHLN